MSFPTFMEWWNPTLAQAITAGLTLAALVLNWTIYRGGSLDRLQKASDLLAKLPTLPADQASLMEARYCAFMQRQFSLRVFKPLAFSFLWLVAGISTWLWGIAHRHDLVLFVAGWLALALVFINFSEAIQRLESPEAKVKIELAKREKKLLYASSKKKHQLRVRPNG